MVKRVLFRIGWIKVLFIFFRCRVRIIRFGGLEFRGSKFCLFR